jgi:hypothetical protein
LDGADTGGGGIVTCGWTGVVFTVADVTVTLAFADPQSKLKITAE